MLYYMGNKWIEHVLEYQKKHNIEKYSEALKLAKPSYYEKYPGGTDKCKN